MAHRATLGGTSYVFDDLKTLLAKATPRRAGDELAGIAAADATERVAAHNVRGNRRAAVARLRRLARNDRREGLSLRGPAGPKQSR